MQIIFGVPGVHAERQLGVLVLPVLATHTDGLHSIPYRSLVCMLEHVDIGKRHNVSAKRKDVPLEKNQRSACVELTSEPPVTMSWPFPG